MQKIAIIGIDSLDPYLLQRYRDELPTFSRLMNDSPTFISKSIFPVDSIPAWMSIFTGLHPGHHGLLYTFDVFDPDLSDLSKLDTNIIKGKTFWDYASQEGFKCVVLYPLLLYPPWEINGIMVCKSPMEKRVDWIRTEIDVDVYPKFIKDKYRIPDKFMGLWGGFPGIKHLKEWAELGKEVIKREKDIGIEICKNEEWDLFFIYFNLLDIIQHRLWRFFDENDPTYCKNHLSKVILEYYKLFDGIVEEFIEAYPDMPLIVMSDHGHRSRPYTTVNINEFLRQKGYLVSNGQNKKIVSKIRKAILEAANRLNIEHWLIKLIVKSQRLTKVSKSIYSSTGAIDRSKSTVCLSNFAGIKSYPHGGIEINRDLVSGSEYEKVREEIIKSLSELKTPDGKALIKWVKRREELYPGKFTEEMYPDIVFELKDDYGVGWDIYSDLFGKAYDHKVASGGHAKDAVFLIRNVNREVMKRNMNVVDVAPTILDLLGIEWRGFDFDGKSIFKQ